MYTSPPGIANFTANVTAASVNTTIINAPGAGFALRIVGVSLAINRLVTGVTDASLQDIVSGNFILRALGLDVNGVPGVDYNYPEPGIQLTANSGLQIGVVGTVAAGQIAGVIFYFLDSVS